MLWLETRLTLYCSGRWIIISDVSADSLQVAGEPFALVEPSCSEFQIDHLLFLFFAFVVSLNDKCLQMPRGDPLFGFHGYTVTNLTVC